MASRFSRYKPKGWQGESYRHYLAAKGIKTNMQRNYFATDVAFPEENSFSTPSQPNQAAKGNYDRGGLKAAYAWGLSKDELRSGAKIKTPSGNMVDAKEYFGITDEELRPKRKKSIEVLEPSIAQEEPFPKTISPPQQRPAPQQFVDTVEQMDEKVDNFVNAKRAEEVAGNTVITPGTPTRTTGFDIGGPYE